MPVCLDVTKEDADAIAVGDEVALYDPEGKEIMATMKVTEKFELTDADKKWECEKVYMGEGTPTAEEFWKIAEEDHPGVQMVMSQKAFNLAGPVKVLSEGDYPTKYAGVYHRPAESRKIVRRSRLERRGCPAAAKPHAPFPRIPVQDRRGSV